MSTFKDCNCISFGLKKSKALSSTKKYSISFSPTKTKNHFISITSILPQYHGSIAIFGISKDTKTLLGTISSQYNLKNMFKNFKQSNSSLSTHSSYNYLVNLLLTKQYNKIYIYYSHKI